MKNLVFLLILFCTLSSAQEIRAGTSKETLQRASSLCPEIAKLTEAIGLARDTGHDIEWTTTIIHNSIAPQKNEVHLIQEMVNFVYMHPEMTPYEHNKKAEPACYQYFGITPEELEALAPSLIRH